ncbi:L-rhamnose mutarotase [Sporosarcina sp. 179-K 3D1 HS]|uniref:L-rhamnose mutarotase n=1 Tax=Sporosarcina sp. 179-K 3D1 HS TaxID=3232169 RepID=UPI00399FF2E1
MLRVAGMIHISDEHIEEYKKLHRQVWPEVIDRIKKSNIQNYSIHLKDNTLFSYYEYVGENYEKDMAEMEGDEATQRWWAICKPLQKPLVTRSESEWWADMEEVFYMR